MLQPASNEGQLDPPLLSVALHGEDTARELAVEARRQATERHRARLAELLGQADGDR